MSLNDMSVALVHGAWADGSSWSKVIGPLQAEGVKVSAAPLPLTSLADDVAALDRTLERVEGPVVLVGHAYAGAVIAATRSEKVRSLVYVGAFAPDEGESADPSPPCRSSPAPSSWRCSCRAPASPLICCALLPYLRPEPPGAWT
jgi:pimeloyl-ACP methyl ester carboxylesterase